MQYEQCRQALDRELGVAPDADTVALYERIKTAPTFRRDLLPPQATPFIGREEELARLRALLANPDCRLITIAGMGGLGKSRLAIRAAELAAGEQLQVFLHGAAFLQLENVDGG